MDTIRQAKDYYESHSTIPTVKNELAPPSDSHASARALGWLSIGLGAMELWKNRQLSEKLGIDGNGRIFQLYGLREIGTGIGLLAAKDPMPWVWARVAGDLLDMATLAPELKAENPQRKVAATATAFIAGAALVDLFCAVSETRQSQQRKQRLLPPDYQPNYENQPDHLPHARPSL